MKHWERYIKKVKCQSCGIIFNAYIYNLKRGWGRFCSISCSKKGNKNRLGKFHNEKTREKISRASNKKMKSGEIESPLIKWYKQKPRFGKNSPNWQGGKTIIGQGLRMSLIYKKWRYSVLERDKYKCVKCGINDGKLQVHHKKSFSQFPQLRFDIDNGETLCAACHNKNKKGRPPKKQVILESYQRKGPAYIRL